MAIDVGVGVSLGVIVALAIAWEFTSAEDVIYVSLLDNCLSCYNGKKCIYVYI